MVGLLEPIAVGHRKLLKEFSVVRLSAHLNVHVGEESCLLTEQSSIQHGVQCRSVVGLYGGSHCDSRYVDVLTSTSFHSHRNERNRRSEDQYIVCDGAVKQLIVCSLAPMRFGTYLSVLELEKRRSQSPLLVANFLLQGSYDLGGDG